MDFTAITRNITIEITNNKNIGLLLSFTLSTHSDKVCQNSKSELGGRYTHAK